MKRTLAILLAFVAGSSGQTFQQPVRVYNLANVSNSTLKHALGVAAQLFAHVGVSLLWTAGPNNSLEGRTTDFTEQRSFSDQLGGRDYLVVTIAKGPGKDVRPGLSGFALPFARTGANAMVFNDRVEKLSFEIGAGPDVGTLLGAAIAHELGHVLMRSQVHSSRGLMKARWGDQELKLLSCNRLQFSPEENPKPMGLWKQNGR